MSYSYRTLIVSYRIKGVAMSYYTLGLTRHVSHPHLPRSELPFWACFHLQAMLPSQPLLSSLILPLFLAPMSCRPPITQIAPLQPHHCIQAAPSAPARTTSVPPKPCHSSQCCPRQMPPPHSVHSLLTASSLTSDVRFHSLFPFSLTLCLHPPFLIEASDPPCPLPCSVIVSP